MCKPTIRLVSVVVEQRRRSLCEILHISCGNNGVEYDWVENRFFFVISKLTDSIDRQQLECGVANRFLQQGCFVTDKKS